MAMKIDRRTLVGGVATGLALARVSSGILPAARAQSASKTFVLIHGAWIGA